MSPTLERTQRQVDGAAIRAVFSIADPAVHRVCSQEKIMTKTAMAIAALTLMTTASASEGILFCGTHFVKESDYTYQVLLKCGPPTWRSFDRWIYDRGPTQATLKVLHIVEHQVSLIADRPRY